MDALDADLDEEQARLGFTSLDTNHDGLVDFTEFCAWWGGR